MKSKFGLDRFVIPRVGVSLANRKLCLVQLSATGDFYNELSRIRTRKHFRNFISKLSNIDNDRAELRLNLTKLVDDQAKVLRLAAQHRLKPVISTREDRQ